MEFSEKTRTVATTVRTQRSVKIAYLRANAVSTWQLLRLRPFDASSEEGRSRERNRRILLTTIAALGGRAVSSITALVSIPLTLHYLGAERYGIWMTVLSLIAMLSFADLGISNGLMNSVGAAEAAGDSRGSRVAISCAFFSLLSVALLIGFIFLISYRWIPWSVLLNVHAPENAREGGWACAAVLGTFCVGLPLSTVTAVQRSLQAGFLNNIWQAAGNVLSLLLLLIAVHFEAPLGLLALAINGGPLLAAVGNHILLFYLQRRDIAPVITDICLNGVRSTLSTGGLFLLLQISSTATFNSPAIVIAQVLGPAAVTSYSVVARMYAVINSVVGSIYPPLWPAFRDAIARGDVAYIRSMLQKTIGYGVAVTSVPYLMLGMFGPWATMVWLKGAVIPPGALFAGFAVWGVLSAFCTPVTILLNAAAVIRMQLVLAFSNMALTLGLTYLCLRMVGVASVPWACLGSFVTTHIYWYYQVYRQHTASCTPT